MSKLVSIHAREVFDSRGRPTVEVEAQCAGGAWGRAIVPSGASTGRHEALELRDGDAGRLGGLGVRKAVQHVNDVISPVLVGSDPLDQRKLDERLIELDGTPNKSRLGANSLLGVSLSVAHAAAALQGISLVEHLHALWQRTTGADCKLLLPLPMVNMISGGRHAGGQMKIQDFLILPVGAKSYRDAFDWIVETYWEVGRELSRRGFEGVLVGDEGGFGPKLPRHEVAFEVILAAIEKTGRTPGRGIAIGIDVAATQFHRGGRYDLGEGQPLSPDELIDLLDRWCSSYPIISIEDALHEDDWEAWARLTARLGDRVQLIGDDLFVTNRQRLTTGIQKNVANCVLIKLNQIGTLSETLDTLQVATSAGYRTVVSARSGETEDATIADLAVATGAGQIKIGSVARSERLAKYNQLLRLEEMLGSRAGYAGGRILARE
ncbi:enolase [Planctomyces sp. SCGC AG-212-M04]|nr:enolase [Planctomyces sp. SCGC AG-212-M04]